MQFDTVLTYYKQFSGNTMVLRHILDAFPGRYFSTRCREMVELIREATESHLKTIDLFTSLAWRFIDCPPPVSMRIEFLNESWKVIALEGNIDSYIKCALAYMQLITCHYSVS